MLPFRHRQSSSFSKIKLKQQLEKPKNFHINFRKINLIHSINNTNITTQTSRYLTEQSQSNLQTNKQTKLSIYLNEQHSHQPTPPPDNICELETNTHQQFSTKNNICRSLHLPNNYKKSLHTEPSIGRSQPIQYFIKNHQNISQKPNPIPNPTRTKLCLTQITSTTKPNPNPNKFPKNRSIIYLKNSFLHTTDQQVYLTNQLVLQNIKQHLKNPKKIKQTHFFKKKIKHTLKFNQRINHLIAMEINKSEDQCQNHIQDNYLQIKKYSSSYRKPTLINNKSQKSSHPPLESNLLKRPIQQFKLPKKQSPIPQDDLFDSPKRTPHKKQQSDTIKQKDHPEQLVEGWKIIDCNQDDNYFLINTQ